MNEYAVSDAIMREIENLDSFLTASVIDCPACEGVGCDVCYYTGSMTEYEAERYDLDLWEQNQREAWA